MLVAIKWYHGMNDPRVGETQGKAAVRWTAVDAKLVEPK